MIGSRARLEGRYVIEPEQIPGQGDGEGLVAIERVKPNSRSPRIVVNVGPKVELQKPREPRQCGQAAGPHGLHPKRHNSQPGLPVMGIDVEAFRQGGLDFGGIPLPVQKRQVGPTLIHHRRSRRALADGEALIKGGRGHFRTRAQLDEIASGQVLTVIERAEVRTFCVAVFKLQAKKWSVYPQTKPGRAGSSRYHGGGSFQLAPSFQSFFRRTVRYCSSAHSACSEMWPDSSGRQSPSVSRNFRSVMTFISSPLR